MSRVSGSALAVAIVAIGSARAQPGSAFRCRDKDPMCTEWAGRGECEKNHDFMAESCAVACSLCANGGLSPTPAAFQLDFVCKGQLAVAPTSYKSNHDELMPSGCAFACRDNMTSCEAAAADGACDKHAEVMRFQCPKTCGVCKALDMPAAPDYPKHLCRHAEGDDPEHKDRCKDWAASGEVRAQVKRTAAVKRVAVLAPPHTGHVSATLHRCSPAQPHI